MSRGNHDSKPASHSPSASGPVAGFCKPAPLAEAIAALIGLALIYAMMALFGNGGEKTSQPAASPSASSPAIKERGRVESAEKNNGSGGAAAFLRPYARGSMAAFAINDKPIPLPDFKWIDEAGGKHSLKQLRGKIILLNLWATWCGPCRKEMPGLDKLQGQLGGDDFMVLAIAMDLHGLERPRRFLDKLGVRNLTLYGAASSSLGPLLHTVGLPVTLLIGRQGRELGRISGGAEWDSQEALALIRAAISMP